jgi:hypothetical protein
MDSLHTDLLYAIGQSNHITGLHLLYLINAYAQIMRRTAQADAGKDSIGDSDQGKYSQWPHQVLYQTAFLDGRRSLIHFSNQL